MVQFLAAVYLSIFMIPVLQSLPVPTENSTMVHDVVLKGSSGYIIVAGGYLSGFVASSYAFDISAGTWSALPDLPTPRKGGGMVAHQGNVYYVSGEGYGHQFYKDVLLLKTAQNAWIEGASIKTRANQGTNAVSLNSSLYALGAYDVFVEKFDCSSGYAWEQVASTQQKHYYSGAAVLNGYIYVCGLYWGEKSNFCERYDPTANKWSTITPMKEKRSGLSMVALNGYLYVIGGATADIKNERYDPVQNEWSYFSAVTNQVYHLAATTDGQHIYVVGGYNSEDSPTFIPDMNVYFPEFDFWKQLQSYPITVYDAGAAFVETLP